MPVKTFSDTSAVSLAYAIDDAADASEVSAAEFNYVPYTSEGFALAKDTSQSAAITIDRRRSGSKNTKGTASGSVDMEFGHTPFILDMLQLAMMGKWGDVGVTDEKFITDGEAIQYAVFERREKKSTAGVKMNYLQRYFGNVVNEATLEIGDGLIGFTVSTMAAYGDTDNADASADDDAGGLATTYVAPVEYEIADASNNVSNIVLKDAEGTALPVTWSSATLTVGNNAREQGAVGSEFAAGMAIGKVEASLSGDIYFYDDQMLNTHLENGKVSAEITIETADGSVTVILPNLKSEAPTANSQGENQDYTQSLTLNAERGEVTIDTDPVTCVIAIKQTPVTP